MQEVQVGGTRLATKWWSSRNAVCGGWPNGGGEKKEGRGGGPAVIPRAWDGAGSDQIFTCVSVMSWRRGAGRYAEGFSLL
jgi:hypothetical protein